MIVYRKLTRDDLPSLLRLYAQLENGVLPELQEAQAVWDEIESRGIVYFGALDGGRVVATCFICVVPNLTHNGRPGGLIENVVTEKGYRRKGLGRGVIQMAIDYAREKGCYKVFLQSGASRTDAHQFYRAVGFDGESKCAFQISFP